MKSADWLRTAGRVAVGAGVVTGPSLAMVDSPQDASATPAYKIGGCGTHHIDVLYDNVSVCVSRSIASRVSSPTHYRADTHIIPNPNLNAQYGRTMLSIYPPAVGNSTFYTANHWIDPSPYFGPTTPAAYKGTNRACASWQIWDQYANQYNLTGKTCASF